MRKEREISLSDIPLPATELLERQIIADAVENPDIIGEVAAVIFPDYFSSEDRKMIWTTIVDMYNARETIDMASVWQRTGQAYIEEIQTKGIYASTRTGFLDHARLLRVANTKKRAYYAAITIAQQSASVGTSEEEIFAAAESLSQRIKADGGSIGESRLLDVLTDVANETEAEQKEAMQGRSVRIPTGFPSLDRCLWGGWGRGQLIILAARPSVGKTAVMLQFAKAAARNGRQTLIFTLEMTKAELGRRLLLSTGLVEQHDMVGRNVDWDKFRMAETQICELPIFINDEARTLQAIISRMTVAVNQGRCKIAMIDYLGLMRFDANSRLTLAQQIGFATTELKDAAKRLGIPIILLVQLNRDSVKEGRPPELQDLRDSGSIEQDADVVLMLSQRYDAGMSKENGDTPFLDIWMRKNRNFKKDLKIVTTPNESYTTFTEHGSIADYAPPEERYNPGGESRDFDKENDPF